MPWPAMMLLLPIAGGCDARRAPHGVPVDRNVARDHRPEVRRLLPDRFGELVVRRAGVARQPRRRARRAGCADRGGAARRRSPCLRPRQGRILLERRRGCAHPRRGGVDHLVGGASPDRPAASGAPRSRHRRRVSRWRREFRDGARHAEGREAARQHHDRGRREAPSCRRVDIRRHPGRARRRDGDAAVVGSRSADGDCRGHSHHRDGRGPAAPLG